MPNSSAAFSDLGRLSARNGLWIENTPSGALLHVCADFAAGYDAWPSSGRHDVYEIDCYVGGAKIDGEEIIVGNDHSPAGKEERARRWREENADALAEQSRLHRETLLPFLQFRKTLHED